jgi:hypothetical protein
MAWDRNPGHALMDKSNTWTGQFGGVAGPDCEGPMVRTLLLLGAGAALAAAGLPLSANAAGPGQSGNQVMCADHRELLSDFKDSYREERGAVGVTDSGQLLEVLVSPKGTWTMLVTQPHGPACVVATGQSWELPRQGGDLGVSAHPDDAQLHMLDAPQSDDGIETWHTGR